jgi:DNA-binding NarL/FixJ family response regulator
MSVPNVTVLIADDHAPIRKALREMLQSGGMEVVGEAGNGEEAVHQCERLRPQIVVLDIAMPVLNGFEAAQRIATRSPDTKVVFLTNHATTEHVAAAFRVGGSAFVRKAHVALCLVKAIEAALEGKTYVSGEGAA